MVISAGIQVSKSLKIAWVAEAKVVEQVTYKLVGGAIPVCSSLHGKYLWAR